MPIENEFPRPSRIDRMVEVGHDVELTASQSECDAVAGRLGLNALHFLTATVKIRPGQLIRLTGIVKAECVQQCVATMQPVVTRVEAPIKRCFRICNQSQAVEIVVNERDDEPEPLNGTTLDLGEIVVEELSLALDTYPRAADAPALEPAYANADRENPFAALRD